MLRHLLESEYGEISDTEFKTICNMVTSNLISKRHIQHNNLWLVLNCMATELDIQRHIQKNRRCLTA